MKKYILFLILFVIISCEKNENLDTIIDNQTSSDIKARDMDAMKLDNRLLSDLEETELLASKILAFKIENDQSFKSTFLESLFNANGLPKENIFLCKVFDVISEVEIRQFLQSIGKTSQDYSLFMSKLNQDYPLMVAKVPLWFGSVWSLSGEDGFNSTSTLINEVKFIPFVEDVDESNRYNTYKFDNSVMENKIINSKAVNFDYLPVLIRQSEYHKIVDIQNLKDQNGDPLFDPYQIDDDPQSPCYTIGILSKHAESIVCYNGNFTVVNWISFLQELFKCPRPPNTSFPEDCYNGIDDDGDGLIDCADPDCDCTEICDNGIDDDGDGLVDADDPDCCWFYAQCDRDCVPETNHIKGLKFVNNYVGLFHNHEAAFDDITGIRVVTYEFVGTAGAVAGSKNFYYPFMKHCGWFNMQIGYPQNPGLNPDFEAFYSAYWSTEIEPSSYCGISVTNTTLGNTFYAHLKQPLVVDVDIKWQDNWNGTLLGNRVRGEVFYLSSDEVSTSNATTYTTQSVTKLGVSFGGTSSSGAAGGNPTSNTGLNVGFTWNSTETETVTSVITINVAPKDKTLGTFDMNYCESNSNFFYFNNCIGADDIAVSVHEVDGTYYSTGAMELWSYINIE